MMINCGKFYKALIDRKIEFFTGVPDSLLKDICAYITDNTPKERNIIAANEGGAIALASGYYLATGKMPLVYMQNSGQGNSINPLASLTDKEVYSIPMLLMIGWRGEPGKEDEPQHRKQGRITLDLLKVLEIPYEILSDKSNGIEDYIDRAVTHMKKKNSSYAFVVRKGTFESYALKNDGEERYKLTREEAIKLAAEKLDGREVIISTTGMISRELFEYRKGKNQNLGRDFLTVGSMGHASQIALGIALSKPNREVYCFDGDGSVIMHLGSLAVIGEKKPRNFKHIVFNNGVHDSVGGQPTAGFSINIPEIAKACGYKETWSAETAEEAEEKIELLKKAEGPSLLEIKVRKGHRKNLSRPDKSPEENKNNFMNFLEE